MAEEEEVVGIIGSTEITGEITEIEEDNVKLAITEFRGTLTLGGPRKATKRGGVRSWVELNDLMRAIFVPKSHFYKLRGELQDLKQWNKSIMEYCYEMIALKGKVGHVESEEVTQDRFIHGLNVRMKHKVQIEAMRGLTMDEVLEFAETFKRQGKEKSASKGKLLANHTLAGTGGSRWSAPPKRVETPNTSLPSTKTPLKALPAPPPVRNTPQAGDKRPQCFKCKGYGHYARECINQRVMVIRQDGQVYSEDEEEPAVEGNEEHCLDTNIRFSSDEELTERMHNLVVRRVLSAQPMQESHREQRANIFHMKYKVLTKICLVIIDGECCTNVTSDKMVAKLSLKELKHPTPYRLQWLGDSGDLKVTTQVRVPFEDWRIQGRNTL